MRCSESPPRTSRCERVVLAALVDRPPLDAAASIATSAVSRIGTREDEQRQHERRDRRLGDLPARREAERAEREAEHLAARVAHEHGGRAARAGS